MVPVEKFPCIHCNGYATVRGWPCRSCNGGHRPCDMCGDNAVCVVDGDYCCARCAGSDAPASTCHVCGDTAVAKLGQLELCERCLDDSHDRRYALREESTRNMARVA